MAVRASIVSQYQQGVSKTQIAKNFLVSRGTVHNIISLSEREDRNDLKPLYQNCGKPRLDSSDFIFRAVRCLRNWHPCWGSGKIRAEMLLMRPDLKLPSIRTMNRWFVWNDQQKKRSKMPSIPPKWAKKLHEGWQIDAKEELITADGQKHCWLNMTDEYSGTAIAPIVFKKKKSVKSL